MPPSFKQGDRVRFRIGGEDLIMTVAAFNAELDFVDLEYVVGREVRRLGIVSRAVTLVDDAGRIDERA